MGMAEDFMSSREQRDEYRKEAAELVRLAHERMREKDPSSQAARPKNIADGTLKAGTSAVAGIKLAAGAVILVPLATASSARAKGAALTTNPVGSAAGAVSGAVGGFVVGAVSGAVVGATSMLTGFGSGLVKIGEGTANMVLHDTSTAGDSGVGGALQVNEEEKAEYETMRDEFYHSIISDSNLGERTSRDIKDTTLYDTLRVSPGADRGAIRAAYYECSAEVNPETYQGEDLSAAKLRFEEIAKAYQILGDPELRLAYDKDGFEAEALKERSEISAKQMHAIMFGSNKFRHLVGDSALMFTAVQVKLAETSNSGDVERMVAETKKLQIGRCQELCQFLIARIEPYVVGNDPESLYRWASLEAAVLAQEEFGVDILHTVGYVYLQKATQALGFNRHKLDIRSFFSGLDETGHMFKLKQRAFNSQLENKMERKGSGHLKRSSDSSASSPEDEEKRAVSNLGVLWLLSQLDIEVTLRDVVETVCTEKGVSRSILIRRAEAIAELGKIYSEI